jgi:hypothetical protein
MKKIEGKLDVYFGHANVDGNKIAGFLEEFDGQEVKITVEVIEPKVQVKKEMVQVRLRKVVGSDAACSKLGINVWCVAEGADGDEWVTVELEDAKRWNLLS